MSCVDMIEIGLMQIRHNIGILKKKVIVHYNLEMLKMQIFVERVEVMKIDLFLYFNSAEITC